MVTVSTSSRSVEQIMIAERDGSAEPRTETLAMFWAHYDDDLVFANPTVLHALDSGWRIESFFFTAGDAGKGMSAYVGGRERGIRAAYDDMRGASGTWSDQSVVLRNGVTVTVTRPDLDDRVSLTFLRLPDGGLRGTGYAATGWESLSKLLTGELTSLRTLDTGQEITLEQLFSTVTELVNTHDATMILSNHPGFADSAGADHPDHQTVGRVVARVIGDGLIDGAAVHYAVGYPGAQHPPNISPDVLARKIKVFAAYGAHDPVVTRNEVNEYLSVRGFGEWLQRQYLVAHSEVALPASDPGDRVASSGGPVSPRADAVI
jgi:LmbE family N-acetylglucosaminyl deacetylase